MEAQEPGLNAGHLRTFQRRVQQWRATRGPEQSVMFGQQRPPGEALQVDWTHPGDLEVSVQGRPLEHLLCHGVLPHSNWQWALRCQSESFLSLLRTLQACLGMLGRAPRFLSTDNSSSATHEVAEGKRGYNKAYAVSAGVKHTWNCRFENHSPPSNENAAGASLRRRRSIVAPCAQGSAICSRVR